MHVLSIRTIQWEVHHEHHIQLEHFFSQSNCKHTVRIFGCGLTTHSPGTCEFIYSNTRALDISIATSLIPFLCSQCRSRDYPVFKGQSDPGRSYFSNEIFSSIMKRLRLTDIAKISSELAESGRFSLDDVKSIYRQADSEITRYIKEHGQPDLVILFNGRMSVPHAYYVACQRNNIPVLCHEKGSDGKDLSLAINATFGNVHDMYRSLDLFHLPNDWAAQLLRYQCGKLTTINKRTIHSSYCGEYIVYFTSSSDEYSADDPSASYESQLSYITRLSNVAKLYGFDFYVRCHPNNGRILHVNEASDFLCSLQILSLEQSFSIIAHDSPLSSYNLMHNAFISFVSDSHLCLEGLAAGLPIHSCNKSSALSRAIKDVYREPERLFVNSRRPLLRPSIDLIESAQRMLYCINVGRNLDVSRLSQSSLDSFVRLSRLRYRGLLYGHQIGLSITDQFYTGDIGIFKTADLIRRLYV